MSYLPYVKKQNTKRLITDTFYGLQRGLKIADGHWNEELNLSADSFPLLSPRKPRGELMTLTMAQGLIAKEGLAYISDDRFFYAGLEHNIGLKPLGVERQLVSMGAYICVFPDKVYFNTANFTDKGSMEAEYISSGAVHYSICTLTGDGINVSYEGPTEPESPQNGEYWINTSAEGQGLYVYSASLEMWSAVASCYTKISFESIGALAGLFSEYDGIEISGCELQEGGERINAQLRELCGSKIIYGISSADEADYIIVIGLLDNSVTQSTGRVSLRRSVPDMDFVIEARNRLWGCRYGNNGERNINELYASALGDFKNWSQYLGISTDSYSAGVGSDGPWTGAVNYLGYPCFFKENCLHRVTVSSVGAHSVAETRLRGVQRGSGKSLQVVNEILYYKAENGICAWQGSFPEGVSADLGSEGYTDAAAGALNGIYYVSMVNSSGESELFTYDTEKRIWHKEDSTRVLFFAALKDELYAVGEDNRLLALRGTGGSLEESVQWMAESGIQYCSYPDNKYVSRYDFRLKMEEGAGLDVYIQYDSEGEWQHSGHIEFAGTGTAALPIRPRRCDHMKLRLTGNGQAKLFSITRVLEQGSDM